MDEVRDYGLWVPPTRPTIRDWKAMCLDRGWVPGTWRGPKEHFEVVSEENEWMERDIELYKNQSIFLWHDDGVMPGLNKDWELIVWSSENPTELMVNGEREQGDPFHLMAIPNATAVHRAPMSARENPGTRYFGRAARCTNPNTRNYFDQIYQMVKRGMGEFE